MKENDRIKLGNTGFEVTRLGFGAFPVGQDRITEKEAENLLNGVLDSGINLIDTARGYGISEERIGKYIAHRRDEYVLSTKVGYDVEGHENWTRQAVQAGIERALRLLRTEVLDIVHLHSCSLEILKAGGVIEGLTRAREAGKIKAVAYSGENEALDYAVTCGAFQSVQFSVNICDQRSIEGALVRANEMELGVIAKRPVANVFWRFPNQPVGEYAEEYWLRAKSMQMTPPEGLDWLEFALRFTAFTPGVHTCIVGTSRLEHFKQNIQILEKGSLESEIIQAYQRLFKSNDQGWIGQV